MSETPPNETLGACLGDAAEKIATAERAAIVAWLRDSDNYSKLDGPIESADAIEAGEHHGGSNVDPGPWPKCQMCGGAKFYQWTTLDNDSQPIQVTKICVGCDHRVVTP